MREELLLFYSYDDMLPNVLTGVYKHIRNPNPGNVRFLFFLCSCCCRSGPKPVRHNNLVVPLGLRAKHTVVATPFGGEVIDALAF